MNSTYHIHHPFIVYENNRNKYEWRRFTYCTAGQIQYNTVYITGVMTLCTQSNYLDTCIINLSYLQIITHGIEKEDIR